MAKSRKDSKGRVLRKGETVRTNGMYQYAYNDKYGKCQYIYDKDLVTLRQTDIRYMHIGSRYLHFLSEQVSESGS